MVRLNEASGGGQADTRSAPLDPLGALPQKEALLEAWHGCMSRQRRHLVAAASGCPASTWPETI